jgi:hypothetical protein
MNLDEALLHEAAGDRALRDLAGILVPTNLYDSSHYSVNH